MSHPTRLRNLRVAPGAALVAGLLLAAPAGVAAATVDVCSSGCAYSQLGPALAAAGDGDTVHVAAGTYQGGFAITHSVRVVGAGAGRTIIKGGGPVVTVGTYLGATQPTVRISGVTITGGVSHSSPQSVDWSGDPNVFATGGGIEIPLPADGKPAASLTLVDSEVTGNRVAPTATMPWGPPCPDGPCPFAFARGGGIDSWGDVTLLRTTVSRNTAGGMASDATGGGIAMWGGQLTVTDSTIAANKALGSDPNGRYAEGGGIFTEANVRVAIVDSVIEDNVAALESSLPYDVGSGNTLDQNANGGGIHMGFGSDLAITRSIFRGNQLRVDTPNGRAYAFDSAIHPAEGGPLTIMDSVISGNRVIVNAASSDGASGSALDVLGPTTIAGTRITGNTTKVTAVSGTAFAAGGAVYGFNQSNQKALIRDSIIRDNAITAISPNGEALAFGGGVANISDLVIRDTVIADNTATAKGASGTARGGGIFNAAIDTDAAGVALTLKGVTITGNASLGGSGITRQGGGLYTEGPVSRTATTLSANTPDDCFGCP